MAGSPSTLRVVIIGGGPIGLIAAHACIAANIDFVLLNEHDNITQSNGLHLCAYPDTLRVFDQLGLLGKLDWIKSTMKRTKVISGDEDHVTEESPSASCQESFGRGIWYFHRPQFLRTIYEALSKTHRAQIKSGKVVVDIMETSTGVEVYCEDGSMETGSIVIGAEESDSFVRATMRSRAQKEGASSAEVNDEKPFQAEYKVLWGTLPIMVETRTNEAWECHGKGVSSQFFIGRGRAWFVVYEKLEKYTSGRKKYTDLQMAEFARRNVHLKMSNSMCLRDVFPPSHSCGMADFGEGVVRSRSWGRMVLVGNAAGQVLPGCGMELGCGVQDVVVLVNVLRRLDPSALDTGISPLRDAFKVYERTRKADFAAVSALSARSTLR